MPLLLVEIFSLITGQRRRSDTYQIRNSLRTLKDMIIDLSWWKPYTIGLIGVKS